MTTLTPEAPADARPGAPLEPAPATWLPLTAGDAYLDRASAPPEHGWPGSWFIFLAGLMSIGMGVGAVGVIITTMMGFLPLGKGLLMAAGLALGCVVQGTLSSHVKSFSRWGWYGAMAELGFATLSKASLVVQDPSAIGSVAFVIVIDLLWMRYFWNHRADFGIDIDLDF